LPFFYLLASLLSLKSTSQYSCHCEPSLENVVSALPSWLSEQEEA